MTLSFGFTVESFSIESVNVSPSVRVLTIALVVLPGFGVGVAVSPSLRALTIALVVLPGSGVGIAAGRSHHALAFSLSPFGPSSSKYCILLFDVIPKPRAGLFDILILIG